MKEVSDNAYFELPPVNENNNEELYQTSGENEYSADGENTSKHDNLPKKDSHRMTLQSVCTKPLDKHMQWKRHSLIIGDNLIYGIDESRIKKIQVRMFPRASVEDITSLLRKNPPTFYTSVQSMPSSVILYKSLRN